MNASKILVNISTAALLTTAVGCASTNSSRLKAAGAGAKEGAMEHEGSCGADMAKAAGKGAVEGAVKGEATSDEASTGEQNAEGSCGGDHKAEGSCGEGSCG